MKKGVLIFFVFLVFAGSAKAQNSAPDSSHSILALRPITFTTKDSWFSRDKAHHFLTSAFLSSAGFYYSHEMKRNSEKESQIVGVCFSLSLGILKEVRDGVQATNSFSWKDLVADCLGTGMGILLMKQ